MNYNPQPGSLPSNVIGFFTNNPGEYLTLEDITDKFGGTHANIHTCLRQACVAGLLTRAQNKDGEYTYQSGPELGKPMEGVDIDRAHKTHAQKANTTEQAVATAPRKHKQIDIASLIVEVGVPIATGQARKGGCKWAPLFDKLKNKGDSIALPAEFGPAIAAAARKNKSYKPGTWRIARVSTEQVRIWRLA